MKRMGVEIMYNLHPGLLLIAAGLLMFILPQKARGQVAIAASAAALAAMILLGENAELNYRFTAELTLQLLCVDKLSWAFGLIFCVIAVIASIYSLGDRKRLREGQGTDRQGCCERAAALIYAGCSISVVFAGDWISLICFWEGMAIASCYLVFAGGSRKAVRASYRYLVMHLFGGNLLLAGAMFIMIRQGMELHTLTGGNGPGYWLVLLGVCINAGIPPFHTWIADAYPESTPSGTVYMGSYTTKAAIYALIRLFAGTEWLVLVGAVMAVFAACMALIENDLRRLLSYHIVSQLGMMAAALGTGEAAGIDGATLHAAFNILYKGVLLMGAGAVMTATGKTKITQLGGLGRKMPVTSVCFLMASLSIAGMPFLNGFASKALIMEALHDFPLAYWLVMLAGVGTWLSITLKINYFVFFGKKFVEEMHRGHQPADFCKKVPAAMEIAMILGTVLCVVTGLMPEPFYEMMPNGTLVHPFTAEHIFEYIGLFIGATVPFVLLLPKMAPHDLLSLDFDWVYRKGLGPLLRGLSCSINKVFARFQWSPGSDEKGQRKVGAFEGDIPVGTLMQVFVVFCVVTFVLIILLE